MDLKLVKNDVFTKILSYVKENYYYHLLIGYYFILERTEYTSEILAKMLNVLFVSIFYFLIKETKIKNNKQRVYLEIITTIILILLNSKMLVSLKEFPWKGYTIVGATILVIYIMSFKELIDNKIREICREVTLKIVLYQLFLLILIVSIFLIHSAIFKLLDIRLSENLMTGYIFTNFSMVIFINLKKMEIAKGNNKLSKLFGIIFKCVEIILLGIILLSIIKAMFTGQLPTNVLTRFILILNSLIVITFFFKDEEGLNIEKKIIYIQPILLYYYFLGIHNRIASYGISFNRLGIVFIGVFFIILFLLTLLLKREYLKKSIYSGYFLLIIFLMFENSITTKINGKYFTDEKRLKIENRLENSGFIFIDVEKFGIKVSDKITIYSKNMYRKQEEKINENYSINSELILKNKDEVIFDFGKNIVLEDLTKAGVALYINDEKTDVSNTTQLVEKFLKDYNKDSYEQFLNEKIYLLFEKEGFKIEALVKNINVNKEKEGEKKINFFVDKIILYKENR